MIVTIDVTQGDIDEGGSNSECLCPVALAISRHVREDVEVRITGWDVRFEDESDRESIRIGAHVMDFVYRIDRRADVQPFAFELDIPEWVLA